MNEINYRELLRKYIDYVGECEGVTFLSWNRGYVDFTEDEWKALQELDNEMS